MDRFGPDNFSTLQIKGHVLHRARAFSINAIKIIPSLKYFLTGVGDFINGVSKDERRGIQFRGTQVIRVFSSY